MKVVSLSFSIIIMIIIIMVVGLLGFRVDLGFPGYFLGFIKVYM